MSSSELPPSSGEQQPTQVLAIGSPSNSTARVPGGQARDALLARLADPNITPNDAQAWLAVLERYDSNQQTVLDREQERALSKAEAQVARATRGRDSIIRSVSGPVLMATGLSVALFVPSLAGWGFFAFGMG